MALNVCTQGFSSLLTYLLKFRMIFVTHAKRGNLFQCMLTLMLHFSKNSSLVFRRPGCIYEAITQTRNKAYINFFTINSAPTSTKNAKFSCKLWGCGCTVKVWFPECSLFGGRNTLQNCFWTKISVRCLEFRGI